jgi:murein DD-endopeptidase
MIGPLETFGLRPLRERLPDFAKALRGNEHTPATKFGLSSVKIFKPRIALKTWLRIRRKDRRVELYNLFNHTPPALEEGYSVRVTRVHDFRGGALTYDSHQGTDFAVPVGTVCVSPAPGRILRVTNELDRGGLKVVVDHGRGLLTTHNHLARSLVKVGEKVKRGQPLALCGASGVELLLCFPWVAPHLHFNTFLNGVYVDPFARDGEVSLWRQHNDPIPETRWHGDKEDDWEETDWNREGLLEAVEQCRDARLKQMLQSIDELPLLAAEILMQSNYYPNLFETRPTLVKEVSVRESRLDLPFRESDYVGVVFPF